MWNCILIYLYLKVWKLHFLHFFEITNFSFYCIEYFEFQRAAASFKSRKIEERRKMDTNWLKIFGNLQSQCPGTAEVEKFFDDDYKWIDEVVTQATTLFKKNSENSSSQIDNSNEAENEEANVSDDGPAPVLLPTTPRVSHEHMPMLEISSNIWFFS